MKKYVFLMFLILTATQSIAKTCVQNEDDPCSTPACPCCYTCDNCTEGCCFKANKNIADYSSCNEKTCSGHEFCKSTNRMTWYDTFTWCENQGRHLALFNELCPGTKPIANAMHGACPNLTSVSGNIAADYAWASYPFGNHMALLVSLTSGGISEFPAYRTSGDHYYAFCY